jgi:hypothetical protein
MVRYSKQRFYLTYIELKIAQFRLKFVKMSADKRLKFQQLILCLCANFSKDPRDGIPRGHHLIQITCCIYFTLKNLVLPRVAGVRVFWLCLKNRCKSLK